MYELIKNSILNPKKLSEYVTLKGWKVLIYFLFLCILFALPDMIALASFDRIPSQTITSIKEAFKDKEINYEITNYQLKKTTDEAVNEIIEIKSLNLSVAFALNDDLNLSNHTKSPIIIVLTKNGAYLTTNFIKIKYDLADYRQLGIVNLDFNLASNPSNTSFWNDFFTYVNKGMIASRFLILSVGIPSIFTSLSIYLLLMVLMTTLIITLFNRYMGAKFNPVFKITIFSYTIYTIGSLLALLFNIAFISSISSIVAIIYAMIGTNTYLRSKIINPN